MNMRKGALVWGWAVGLGLATVTFAGTADAGPPAKAPAKKVEVKPTEPATTKVAIKIEPSKIAWGMSVKQLTELYDKALDEEYKPKFKAISVGPKLKMLESSLAEEKSEFRRSRIDFGKTPTGLDSTPLKPEYSYLNKESVLISSKDGKKRYYFFIADKLWKIVDDIKLTSTSPLGKTYAEAVASLTKTYGVAGRKQEADFAIRYSNEVDWKDSTTHLRAAERSEANIALIYEDWATSQAIASLRPNKPADNNGIDPVVAGAIRKAEPETPLPAPPAPVEKNKPGAKGGKQSSAGGAAGKTQ